MARREPRRRIVQSLEPGRVAVAVEKLGLNHVVITSVDRDDLPDGGAGIWARTLHACHEHAPRMTIEVLVPDFKGNLRDVDTVLDAGPDVFAHNLETVPRLFRKVQPQDKYEWAMSTLGHARELDPLVLTKSGIMVGLGGTFDEVVEVMRDLRAV
ncbi:MAG: radical SAM protein, partial [Myxococcales bacterium]|nr:radical SAM protein [Myxococcales bacterium]